MRNPIRLKNLSLRLAPYYALALAVLWFSRVSWRDIGIGITPVLAGVLLRSWAAGHLVKNDRFTVSGPYARMRHPLYLGTLCLAVGFASMLGGWMAIAATGLLAAWFFGYYYARKESLEAERLEARYGQVYRDYREQVPALLPRLEAWRPDPGAAQGVQTAPRWSIARYDANNEFGTLLAVTAGVGFFALRASLA